MFDTATHLWRTADKSTRLQAAEAFWGSEERPEHAQASAFIAQKLNLRPATARRLPPERKASYLAQFDTISELLCAQLWTAFYLTHRREMLSMFLDALSIKHQHGLFEGEDVAPPPVAALTPAIRQLVESFGAEEVRRYLSILAVKDPVFWGGLGECCQRSRAAVDDLPPFRFAKGWGTRIWNGWATRPHTNVKGGPGGPSSCRARSAAENRDWL